MKLERIIIEDHDIQALGSRIKKYQGSDYQCVSDDMIIIGVESLRLRTTSTQWDMVVLKRIDTKIQVDIVGTAGGSGIFNISWGSEKSFIKEMRRFLIRYCEENEIRYDYSNI